MIMCTLSHRHSVNVSKINQFPNNYSSGILITWGNILVRKMFYINIILEIDTIIILASFYRHYKISVVYPFC